MGNMCAEMKEKVTFCAGSVVEKSAQGFAYPGISINTHKGSRVNIRIIS